MSSAVIPDQNVEENFPENPEMNPADNVPQSSTFQQGRKTLRKSVAQGASLSLQRRLFVGKIAAKKEGDKGRAYASALREYNALVRQTAAKIQGQNPTLSPSEARFQAEREVLSKPNYLNLLTNNKFVGAAGSKAKKAGIKAAQKAALSIPFVGPLLSFLLGKKWFQKIFFSAGLLVVLMLCCVCCLCMFLIFQMYQTFTSENKVDLFVQSAQLINCAGLPEDIQNPSTEDMTKLTKCLVDQKVEEYSVAEPIPE